jgi:hypothetical protein
VNHKFPDKFNKNKKDNESNDENKSNLEESLYNTK